MKKPKILLTNDDGIGAEGLELLTEVLKEVGEVLVVAPDRQRSGAGHSITLHRPLRATQLDATRTMVDGTPTDCVNLALNHLFKGEGIDMVVSGINAGLNSGDDVTYSGTLGAAFEAHLYGIPAIGFSQDVFGEYDFAHSAQWAKLLVESLLPFDPESRLLLSVNFPAIEEFGGWTLTRLGRRFYREVVVEKTDPRGGTYYWIAGTPEWEGGSGTDFDALERNLISVTPLHLDLTDFRALEYESGWHDRLPGRVR